MLPGVLTNKNQRAMVTGVVGECVAAGDDDRMISRNTGILWIILESMDIDAFARFVIA